MNGVNLIHPRNVDQYNALGYMEEKRELIHCVGAMHRM